MCIELYAGLRRAKSRWLRPVHLMLYAAETLGDASRSAAYQTLHGRHIAGVMDGLLRIQLGFTPWQLAATRIRRQFPVPKLRVQNREGTNADPSTHHPQTVKRLGPISLRMTGHFMLWTLGTGRLCGDSKVLG
jgi:hypothetical protein